MSSIAKLAVLVGVALIVFGCNRQGSGIQRDRLVVGLEGSPKTLDPRLAQDAYSSRLLALVFEGLVRVDKNSEHKPLLARAIERPDPRTYIFRLKKGRRFADGAELTARDVVYTIDSLDDKDLKSSRKYIRDAIGEIRADDRYTVTIVTKKPNAPFLSELTFGILPAKAHDDYEAFMEKPHGTGPYRVELSESGERVVLVRNEHYAGPAPPIGKIVFRVLDDDVTRVLALEHGEVQLLQNSIPPDDLPLVKKNKRLRLMTEQGINYSYIGLNLEDPVLKNRDVRRAIAHGIDRDKIVECLLQGSVTPAEGILSPAHWAYSPDVVAYDHDPEKAKELLDKAGFPDPDGDGPKTRFDLVYKTSQNKVRRWVAEAIADQLRRVGIGVEIRTLEFGSFFDDIRNGRFQMYSLTWTGITEPDIYHYVFHSGSVPPSGGNRNRYWNRRMDELTERGRLVFGREERAATYAEVQRLVSEDLPYISLWYTVNTAGMDRRLEGFEFYPGGDWRSLARVRWAE